MWRQYAVGYLKFMTIVGIIFSVLGWVLYHFDPWGSLDSLLWADLYGQPTLPAAAEPAFQFAFSLFCLISIVALIMQYAILKYVVEKGEAWGAKVLLAGMIVWVLGAVDIAFREGAKSYLVSATFMTVLFIPALLIATFSKKA